MRCPRCPGTLHEKRLEQVDVHVCDGCTGTLIAQPLLVGVLEALCKATLLEVDLDAEIPAMPDDGTHLSCPQCSQTMEAFGYMGATQVIVDRCANDRLIWADPDELGTMAVLYARTNRRFMERHKSSLADRQRFARATQGGPKSPYMYASPQDSQSLLRVGSNTDRRPFSSIWTLLEALFGGGDDDSAAY